MLIRLRPRRRGIARAARDAPEDSHARQELHDVRGRDVKEEPLPRPRGTGLHGALPRLDVDEPAPPFDYNPSSWSQRLPIAGLALVATGMSVYLGLYQWEVIDTVWDPIFGEGTANVLTSEESEAMHRVIGLPDAVLGAWAYSTEVVLSLAGSVRRWQFRPWMVLLFGLDVIPLGIVSAILVVLQGTSVGAWCFLCLVTAVISLILAYLAYDEVWATTKYLWRIWRSERDPKLLWDTFIGRASQRAYEIAQEQAREARGA